MSFIPRPVREAFAYMKVPEADIFPTSDSGNCGVCEKPNPTVFWWTTYSTGAHPNCYTLIKTLERDLTKTIDVLFTNEKDYYLKNRARMKAVGAVKAACGSETIMSYQKKNGSSALTKLFNTVGIEAAKKYASHMNPVFLWRLKR